MDDSIELECTLLKKPCTKRDASGDLKQVEECARMESEYMANDLSSSLHRGLAQAPRLLVDFFISIRDLSGLLVRLARGERFTTCCVINQRTLSLHEGKWQDFELGRLVGHIDDCLYLIEPNLATSPKRFRFASNNWLRIAALTIPMAALRRIVLRPRDEEVMDRGARAQAVSDAIQEKIFWCFLKMVGAKEIYLKAYYNPSKIPLCIAAVRLGVSVNEVQHSYIYSGHPGYKVGDIRCKVRELKPDVLWLNDRADLKFLSRQGYLLASQYPRAESAQGKFDSNIKFDAILVCQYINIDFYVRTAKSLGKHHSVAVKLHPMYESEQARAFLKSGMPAARILPGSIDVKSCIDLSNVFIGEFSSGLVWALGKGKLIFVVGEIGRNKLAEFHDEENAIFCEETELSWRLEQCMKKFP